MRSSYKIIITLETLANKLVAYSYCSFLFCILFLPANLYAEATANSAYSEVLTKTAQLLRTAGFIDPRKLAYQEFAVLASGASRVVPGFRVSTPGSTPVQFLTWNGVLLESTAEGVDADLEKDIRALTTRISNQPADSFGWDAADQTALAYDPQTLSPLHSIILEMLGRNDSALKLISQLARKFDVTQLHEALLFHWSWALALTGLTEFGANRLIGAELNLKLLERAWTSISPILENSKCSGGFQNFCQSTIGLPWQEILKDTQRRLLRKNPPNCSLLESTSSPSSIINCLEEISEQQNSFPGSIPFWQSRIYQLASSSLIQSLPALTEVALHDQRLTRSVGAWRPFAFTRHVLPVAEVAQHLIQEIIQNNHNRCTELLPLLPSQSTANNENSFQSDILKLCRNQNWANEALDALESPKSSGISAAQSASTLAGSVNPNQALEELISAKREEKVLQLPITSLGEEFLNKASKLVEVWAARALGEMQANAAWHNQERQEAPAFALAVAGARISPERGTLLLRNFLTRLVTTRIEGLAPDKITLNSMIRAYLCVVFLADLEDREGLEIARKFPDILKIGSFFASRDSQAQSQMPNAVQAILPRVLLKHPIAMASPTPLAEALAAESLVLKLSYDGQPISAEHILSPHAACDGSPLQMTISRDGPILKSLNPDSVKCTVEFQMQNEITSKLEKYMAEFSINSSQQAININLLKQFEVRVDEPNETVNLSGSQQPYEFPSASFKLAWDSFGTGVIYSYDLTSSGDLVGSIYHGTISGEPRIGFTLPYSNPSTIYELRLRALRGGSPIGIALGSALGQPILFRIRRKVTDLPNNISSQLQQGRSKKIHEANERIQSIIKLIGDGKTTKAKLQLEKLTKTDATGRSFAYLILGFLNARELNLSLAVQNFIQAYDTGDEFFKQASGGETVLSQARHLFSNHQTQEAFALLNKSLYGVLKAQDIKASSVTEFFEINLKIPRPN